MGLIDTAASEIWYIAYLEQASDPATIATRWQSYFKSGGMYHKDPNGTVLRLLTTADIGSGGALHLGAFTQTYSTANATLSAYTPDVESAAYTGIDNAQVGSVYATVADLNALRVAVENLRAFTEDGVQFLNALVDAAQAAGIAT